MPTGIIIAALSAGRVLSSAVAAGRTIRRPGTHAHSHPDHGGGELGGGFKAHPTAQAVGAGDERRRDGFKGGRECF